MAVGKTNYSSNQLANITLESSIHKGVSDHHQVIFRSRSTWLIMLKHTI